MTMPTAFAVSMLAWGALAFPSGFEKAHQMPHLLQTARWGSDYLMKTWKPDTLGPSSAGYLIIYQVLSWQDQGSEDRAGESWDLLPRSSASQCCAVSQRPRDGARSCAL